ncbi:MAG: hypothetical protein QGG48_02005 [Desulfatiglandales bacterium]|jgi:hypothetical protein|nr:hypothetical protein [Desulfatiglandales bacterium]
MIYEKMSRDEARTYLCTMFAAYGMGLDEIANYGQEFILLVEAGASSNGFTILKEIGVANSDLKLVTAMMTQWYATYEALCEKDVVRNVRKRIIKDKKAAFLVSEEIKQSYDKFVVSDAFKAELRHSFSF